MGVLEVNCYEVDPSAGVRGFYPLASLLSHSCVANCRTVWAGRAGDWAASTWAATDMQVGGDPDPAVLHCWAAGGGGGGDHLPQVRARHAAPETPAQAGMVGNSHNLAPPLTPFLFSGISSAAARGAGTGRSSGRTPAPSSVLGNGQGVTLATTNRQVNRTRSTH